MEEIAESSGNLIRRLVSLNVISADTHDEGAYVVKNHVSVRVVENLLAVRTWDRFGARIHSLEGILRSSRAGGLLVEVEVEATRLNSASYGVG
jgi:hypothetical protein